MRQINLELVNEINKDNNLDYTVIITDYFDDFQKLDFVNKSNSDVKCTPVIGTPLHIQYYLLGMQKYARCLIPF